MALHRILKYPDPILRKRSEEVALDNLGDLPQLLEDMEDTLEEVDTGAAIAAVQIGVLKRLFATNQLLTQKYAASSKDPAEAAAVMGIPPIIINPTILSVNGQPMMMQEGCLSFPGLSLQVRRWPGVLVEYDTVLGSKQHGWEVKRKLNQYYSGFWGQVFQHEIDHLDGKLFVDALPIGKRLAIAKKMGAKR